MEDTSASVGETTPSAETSTPTSVDASLDASFAELSGSGESATPETPAVTPEAQQAVAPPTVEPVADGKGPIPFERHQAAIQNARQKAGAEFYQQYEHAVRLQEAFQADMPGTLTQLIQEAVDHPQYGQTVLSAVARLLGGRRQRLQEDIEPEADLQTPDGALVYSAEQLKRWQQWNAKQQQAQFDERFKPLNQLQEQIETAKKHQQLMKLVDERAKETAELWQGMPFFNDHKAEIMERQEAIYEEAKANGSRMDAARALALAYKEVATAKGVPALQAKQQAQLIQTAVAKSRGSTSDPASSAPAQPRRARTPDEAIDQVFDQAGV